MLVLSRKKNEAVVINENILVTVIELRGDKVRLGFEHPKEMSVHRKEVYDAIHALQETPAESEVRVPAKTSSENAEHLKTIERQNRIIQQQSELIHKMELMIRDYRQTLTDDQ
jgi:carbon storage regulator